MRVAVIGAGLAGLRAAALLGERGATVEVFEASDRLGGRLCTARPHPGIAYEAGGEWIDHDHFLRETRGGGVHDKRIAEGTPSPFPAGEPVVAGSGLSGGTLLQVEILKPTKTPRGQELTVDEKGANQALCHRRRRIEHVHSSGKRYRIVKDRMHSVAAGRLRFGDETLLCLAAFPGAPDPVTAAGFPGIHAKRSCCRKRGRCMIHPHTELRFINEKIGYGVVATQLIPRGTITWVRDEFDQAFSALHIASMAPLYRALAAKYCFVDAKGDYILRWDLARYVNHSCDPACCSAGYDFELAVRDIHPGEELTDDYGSLNLAYEFVCCCVTPFCRENIRPDDLLRYVETWDAIVAEPFRRIPVVSQPLWPLVKEQDIVAAVLANQMPIASCRHNYYPGTMLHYPSDLRQQRGGGHPCRPAVEEGTPDAVHLS